jgi:hypothetical protein
MTPDDDIVRPAGRVGETLNVNGPAPPDTVTGVKDTGPPLWEIVVVPVATCAGVTGAFTVRLNVAVAVALLASVTVTV